MADKLASYPDLTRKLLLARDITEADEAEKYLNPSYERDLYDPFLMKDMTKAVKRILQAIEDNERIVIYGDYDADGVPGVVVITSYFKEIGFTNFDIYIPDRGLEGYGMKDEAIIKLAEAGTKLVITVDCGASDVSQIAKAKELGIDMVITDHHLLPKKVPKAVAIVDNKQEKDEYPYKMLCGCAVAFKLVQALMKAGKYEFKEGWDKWLLDLVALATISDMVPLDGENRALTHFGLKVLRRTRRPGLLELFKATKIKRDFITEDDIGFVLAPRLNAASRMSHAVQSYFLLTTADPDQARDIAKHLEEKNNERKKMVDSIVGVVESRLLERKDIPAIIVAGDPTWPAGGLGLAANKIKDKYNKPVFIWGGLDASVRKGSSRSDGETNLVALMAEAGGKKFFNDFGGHFMAAGFSFTAGKEEELEKRLLEAFSKVKGKKIEEDILVDAELSPADLIWDNYFQVEALSPFGIGNPKPIFLLKGVEIKNSKAFGNGGIHLELTFIGAGGKPVSAIGFFTCTASDLPAQAGKFDAVNGHIYKGVNLTAGEKIDALVNLEKSTFKNYPELRLRIVDLRKPRE